MVKPALRQGGSESEAGTSPEKLNGITEVPRMHSAQGETEFFLPAPT